MKSELKQAEVKKRRSVKIALNSQRDTLKNDDAESTCEIECYINQLIILEEGI